MSTQVPFQRVMKKYHVAALAVGGTVSSVYFLGNGYLLREIGPFAFLAFIFGGLISYLTMSCLAELAANEELTHHSFLQFMRKYISPTWSCGLGWAYWVDWVIIIAAECLAGGILMHAFVPQVSAYSWAVIFALFVTYINLRHVKLFSITAFWLTFTHIALFAGFTLLALWIFFTSEPFIGTTYLLQDGVFPNGIPIFFLTMVILLLNFQGTELIALSASETQQPSEKLPKTMKQVSLIISGLYVVPIFLLGLIYPSGLANLEGSVFATAIQSYGFKTIAQIFTFLIVAGSLSCANSGLYAAVRAMHALSSMGMAPRFLEKLSTRGTPQTTTLVTFGALWIMLLIFYYFPSDQIYVLLLAFSGFAGSILWISICWAQLRARRKFTGPIRVKMPGYPYLTYFAIWAQIFCALIVIWNEDLRISALCGMGVFLLPMLIYRILRPKNGN
jgi:AAT family amino acid transporter